jgi:transposase
MSDLTKSLTKSPTKSLTWPPTRFIGCDVGKSAIAVFDAGANRGFTLPNERDALDGFAAGLDATCFVICEATGGHEAGLLDALVRAGRAVHRADARKVKAFIRSLGTLGKSDAIEARALARYAQERHDRLPLWRPREPVRDELHVMVTTRRDLVAERVACANRLAAPGAAPIAARLKRLLAALEAEIAGLEADMDALIAATHRWSAPQRLCAASPASEQQRRSRSSPSCPSSEPSTAARRPPLQAWRRTRAKAAKPMLIGEPAAADQT